MGALVVYDVTKRSSFASVERWVKELRASAEPNIVIMLVGNKIDLCEEAPSSRQVSAEEGAKLADQYQMMFEESSAVKDINVRTSFESLLESTMPICDCRNLFRIWG